ncbi:restriction endonuclease subunit S [Eubacterium maltosivorans]|uniref:Restriction endonuclease subunit S n=1 Tax=Eubacterium maltosivorans TaxID=2041044 RepID=A0A4P9C9T8_EUBML|nr:restriction endonuclease subunit S [Eubacterium maltosivorans]QCT72183.1 restriction endonuclease subunit S [Eubacterium maltosivorans]
MSEKKRMAPKLRFPRFTDDWEQRKLGEYLEVSPKKNKEETYDKTDVLSVSGDVGIVNQIEFQGRSFAGVSVANYGVVENEDVVYTKSPLKANPYGIIKTNKGKAGIVSTLYAVYKPRDIADPKFVQVYFEQDTRMNNYMRPLVNKGAKNDMKVSNENALKGLVIFPKLEEQRQISTYFESFDHLITLHQRKLDHLKDEKKSLLQKMFPKKGEDFPELRFPGFTDAWEQRKLGELADNTYGGGTPNTSNDTYWNGEIPWIQSSDLKEHRIFGVKPRKYISQSGLMNSATKLVPENSIAIITRVGVGKLAVMPFSYTTSQDFLSLSRIKTDIWFTAYLIYRKLQRELNSVQGTSIKGITKGELIAKMVSVPTKNEQVQIGCFFRNLDTLITLHQRKLDHLQDLKKALLQSMFV